ncbi:MAG: hypothetical protein LBB45_00255 [Methanobrevibacter sp.]|jgi:hypothetical protein|nr:hypothetical protein [Candidatus Methanovirga basalitermitum]
MSITKTVNVLLKDINEETDINQEIQSDIHEELLFKRNSINLLIGKRGSGKTFNVFRELIKLSQAGIKDYKLFLYITDKTYDDTYNKMKKFIDIQTHMFNYEDALTFLPQFINAKSAYDEVLETNCAHLLTAQSKQRILETLYLKEFEGLFHIIVLYDDAINIFKVNKYKVLLNLLFQNRQSKITYFLCIQDMFGIPPQVKANLDSLWLFGKFSDKGRFNYLMLQLGQSQKAEHIWNRYQELNHRQAIIFIFNDDGIKRKYLDQ